MADGTLKNIKSVKKELRGKRYSVTRKTDSGIKIGTIEGEDGEYMLFEEWLEPDVI